MNYRDDLNMHIGPIELEKWFAKRKITDVNEKILFSENYLKILKEPKSDAAYENRELLIECFLDGCWKVFYGQDAYYKLVDSIIKNKSK